MTSILLVPVLRAERLPFVTRLGLGGALTGLALIGVLVGLRLSFQIEWSQVLQPFVAVSIPILFWLGFEALTVEDPYPWRRALLRHGGVAVLALLGVALRGADFVLPLLTLGYLVLLVRLFLRPGEAFLHLTARELRVARTAMLIVILLYVFVFLADLTILIAILMGRPGQILSLVSGASGVMAAFVFLAVLIGLPLAFAQGEQAASVRSGDDATDEDRALLVRFDALLSETALFTDSGLTLARAARRLGVPARDLSRAVNRVEAQNFSRHINGFRIEHAKHLLRETELPVTDVMLEAGFLTKSTFNTEFRRITGVSPSAFRSQG
ncbi:MAG: helix-turn-helix transcriptional regulator [Pseudomonadota bacterium]